jgi:hypothetical protein
MGELETGSFLCIYVSYRAIRGVGALCLNTARGVILELKERCMDRSWDIWDAEISDR